MALGFKGRLVAPLIGLVLVPALFVVMIPTAPGRALLRWGTITAANSTLNGTLEIGAVEGSPFGLLRLVDVRIRDEARQTALAADRIEIVHRLWALLGGRVHIQRADVDGLVVDWPRLQTTLPSSNAPSTDSAPTSESIPITADHIAVRASRLTIADGQTIEQLQLVATATLAQPHLEATIHRLVGRRNRVPFRVHGTADYGERGLSALKLAASIGGLRLNLERTAKTAHRIDVVGRLQWPPGALAALLSQPQLRGSGDLKVHLVAGDRAPDRDLSARVWGRLGGGHVDLQVRRPTAPLSVRVVAKRFDPARIHDAAPPSRLNLTMTATVHMAKTGPRGHGRLDLRGIIRPTPASPVLSIDAGRLDVRGDHTRGSFGLTVDTSAGRVRATGQVRAPAGEASIEAGILHVDGLRLDRLSGDQLAGTVGAVVQVSGPARAPSIQAELRASRLVVGALTLGDIDARTRLATGPQRVAIDWSRLEWKAPATTWTSTAGRVRLAGKRLTVDNLHLSSDLGRLQARADLVLDAPLGPHSKASIALKQLDLRSLTGLHPSIAARPRGTVTGTVRFDGAQKDVDFELDVRRARWSRAWPTISARARGDVSSDRARVTASGWGAAWGQARVVLDVAAPTKWRQPAHWAATRAQALRKLDSTFDLKLRGLNAATFQGGYAKGSLQITAGARRVQADIQTANIAVKGLPEIGAAALQVESGQQTVKLNATASIQKRRALKVQAVVHAPLVTVLERPWRTLRAELEATSDRFPIEVLGLRPPWGEPSLQARRAPISGELSLHAHGRLSPAGPRMRADLRLRRVHLNRATPPITLDLMAEASTKTASATLSLTAPELGEHRARLLARMPKAFDIASIAPYVQLLELDSNKVSLAAVGSIAGIDGLAGTFGAEVAASDGLRSVTAQVDVKRVTVHPAVSAFDLTARITESSTQTTVRSTVLVDGHRFLRARLETPRPIVDALGGPVNGWPLAGRIESQDFPLSSALVSKRSAKDLDGRLTMQVALAGTFGEPIIDASARSDELRLGDTRFTALEVDHHQGPDERTSRARFAQDSGGHLRLDVDASDPSQTKIAVAAQAFRLGFLTPLTEWAQAGTAIDGRLDGAVTVHQQPTKTSGRGRITAQDLRLAFVAGPPIDSGSATLVLDGDRAQAELQARSGSGKLNAELALNDGDTVRGRFSADEIHIAGGGQIIAIDLGGSINGQQTADGFDATVLLDDGLIRLPERSARALHPITRHSDVVFQQSRWQGAVPAPKPTTAAPPWTVRIRTAKPVGVRGAPIEAMLNVDVTARPQGKAVAVRGDARAEQGTVTLFGRRYTIERARVLLGGHVPSRPRVDVLLSYDFNACTFFVGTSGPLDDPKLTLSADPAVYTDKQLLGFLFGASPDEDNPNKTPEQQGIDAAAGVLLGQLQSQLKQNLPIDTLAVDLGDGADSGQANVSLGKWITDRLFVAYTYRHGAAQTENTSEGLLRYRFLRSWLVELVFGDRGNGAADILWRKRW